MLRWGIALIATTLAAAAGTAPPPTVVDGWGQRTAAYDGEFTFVRVRWRSGLDGQRRPGSSNNFWLHEFPRAERNFMGVLRDVTLVNANAEGSLILTLDDPNLFRFPIAVLWEPGYWLMTEVEVEALRKYLLKGGFLIVNDFELEQWENFEAQTKRVLPNARWIRLDKNHRVFQSFFTIDRPDVPHAAYHHLVGLTPEYFGLFEDNDPNGRMMAIANYNTNLAEYWQVADAGFFPIESANNAFKLGINYVVYGLTH
jgi:hypothetical protein